MTDNQAVAAVAPVDQPCQASATAPHDERLALIRAYQNQALQRADPLAANLAVLTADLFQYAYRLKQSMEESLTGSPADYADWAPGIEWYLRCVRQIDRLAQLERQLAQPGKPSKHS
jgi:hypothetical protein